MLDNLGPGDLITTELVVDNNQGVVTKITKTRHREARHAGPAGPATAGCRTI